MQLSSKILLAAFLTVSATILSAVGTVYVIARQNRVHETHRALETMVFNANEIRDKMETLYATKMIDLPSVLATWQAANPGKDIHDHYRETPVYDAVPIVATWNAIGAAAEQAGYSFRVVARPDLPARNTDYKATEADQAIFDAFAAGEPEYFIKDKASQQLVYAYPVTLTQGCLACHGDPATSPHGNGKDLLGFPMENMKAGDLKGAFVITVPLEGTVGVEREMASISIVGAGVLVAALAGFALFNQRYIQAPLKAAIARVHEVTQVTSTATSELSRSNEQLADGTAQQAAALEESSAALEEISGVTARNAESAAETTTLTREARTAAEQGRAEVERMAEAMRDIQASSDRIAKVVDSIEEIAFQTNMLALNAAVEAARAGEAGAGFAVVAEEVRNLAHRSAQAAKESTTMIEESVARSRRGVEISTTLQDSLRGIETKVQAVDTLVRQIATASAEQKQGLHQVAQAVHDIDTIVQAGAAMAEENASASALLQEQSDHLVEAMRALEQMAGASSRDTPHA